jgi:integrase/recombinase XerD
MTPLRRRMTEDMQVRNFSPHTQNSYVQQVSLFARHFSKSPAVLGPEEIRSYQVYLTNERKLATSSILIAVSALRFLYKVTLHRDWCLEPGSLTRSRMGGLRQAAFRRARAGIGLRRALYSSGGDL